MPKTLPCGCTCSAVQSAASFGHEWNLANQEYLFHAPPIEVADWLREPYQQPAAMMIYSAVMRDYFAKAAFKPTDWQCRTEGCPNKAIHLSIFCRDHHIQSLQQRNQLPKPPAGRLFPPYYVAGPGAP